MADQNSNVSLVQQGFADFASGDIESILSRMDEGIVWDTPFPPNIVPYGGKLTGTAAVRNFFQSLAETTTFQQFEVREFIASGNKVVAVGEYDSTIKDTGKRAAAGFAMVFTVENDKIVAFCEYTDADVVIRAFTKDEGRVVEPTARSKG
jgi:ketosteroid isomerase-like protein